VAEEIRVDGQIYKKRNPWGVIGLSIITLGIYALYWYWAINDEARRYLRDETIRPVIALLAVTLGVFLIVPPFVSAYHTGQRIERMQGRAGIPSTMSPVIFLVLWVFINIVVYWYGQSELNKIWDAAAPSGAAPVGSLPPTPA
jgi:uncharacterized membrane protein required for colicin V production